MCFYMCVCLWGFEYYLNIFDITGPCVYGQRLNIAGLCLGGTIDNELDPVGSTVRYEMIKLCTGSVGHYETVVVGN